MQKRYYKIDIKNTRNVLQEDKDCELLLDLRVSRDPKDFLLLHIDGCFYLRAHVSDVHALNHDCKRKYLIKNCMCQSLVRFLPEMYCRYSDSSFKACSYISLACFEEN